MRILLSVLLLAPPAFCMGMMFPLGLEHLAPSRGAASVLLERQRHYVDVCLGAGHGAVDRIRHRQDLCARRRLLCRLCLVIVRSRQANRMGEARRNTAGAAASSGSARPEFGALDPIELKLHLMTLMP